MVGLFIQQYCACDFCEIEYNAFGEFSHKIKLLYLPYIPILNINIGLTISKLLQMLPTKTQIH